MGRGVRMKCLNSENGCENPDSRESAFCSTTCAGVWGTLEMKKIYGECKK